VESAGSWQASPGCCGLARFSHRNRLRFVNRSWPKALNPDLRIMEFSFPDHSIFGSFWVVFGPKTRPASRLRRFSKKP
jgi:hypothetical protein